LLAWAIRIVAARRVLLLLLAPVARAAALLPLRWRIRILLFARHGEMILSK